MTSIERRGEPYWSLTSVGREQLAREHEAGEIGELPESPQHRTWRHAREDHCVRFGKELRRIRREAGISMETLGNRAGLHRTEIGHLEHAGREPRLTTIIRVAHVLDISASRLLEGVDRLEGDGTRSESDPAPLVAVRGPRSGHREVLRTPRKRGPQSPASALEERQTAPPRSPATKERSGSDSAHAEEDAERSALERRVGTQHLAHLEGDAANNLRLTTALRLTCSLGASIERLTDRICWTPGQIVRGFEQRRPVERLSGFFQVLPGNVPAFEPPPSQDVEDRGQAAAIFGASIRDARERRHLTQAGLARKAGLGKNGLSLIERGIRETSVAILLALARSLEVPPDFLLGGIVWSVGPQPGAASRARQAGCSLDIAIRRLWNEGKTAREIAETLGTSPGTVSATVHRLRERGEPLGYRRPPTRGVHARAR